MTSPQIRLPVEPQPDDNAPWKRRYRVPRIRAQVARDNPDRALIFSNSSGKYEIYAADLARKPPTLLQLTDRPSGTVFGYISPDGKYVYYLNDKLGNETGHFVRVPFDNTSSEQDMTPAMEQYTAYSCFADSRGSHFGFTEPSREGFDTYVVDIGTEIIGVPRRINRSTKLADGPIFSADGKVCAISSAERLGGLDFSLLSFDIQTGKKLGEIYDESSRIEPFEFSPISGDYRILATTNKSGDERPFLWDTRSGARTDFNLVGLEGSVVPLAWSPDSSKILLCQIFKASYQLFIYDLRGSRPIKIDHPNGTFDSACFRSNNEVIVKWQNSTNPARLIVFDISVPQEPAKRPEYEILFSPSGDVPRCRSWKSITFKSSDGQEIQGWLAVPDGLGPFPTIFETHGGPTAVRDEAFMPSSQAWLDHGFAYFTINYRGSTTFGRDFEKKIIGDLGHWEVQDMVAGRNFLLENKISIPDQIFLTGWSYGGYLTLHAMGLYPELWAGGAGGVVVADWATEYEDESESLRGYDIALFGGPPSEKRDLYVKASPITYVENLKAPVLIIQGRNDTRDPPRQVELYEKKARQLKKDVRVEWFDTGHTGTTADINLAIQHQEMILRFFCEILRAKAKNGS
jgi:pimeloyl-ACP methyl ester carboxylesterase